MPTAVPVGLLGSHRKTALVLGLMAAANDVLHPEPERLVDGDLLLLAAARMAAEQHFAQLGENVVGPDQPGVQRRLQVTGLGERRLAAVHEERRPCHRLRR
ncbi:hypothetical protein SHKM778_46120 [Streptomyces sp. KM77-8]|uniref:Uncharacterized protein n=1 Tax=Streptomyces haneummycinicus TaxID=3074435 RepID=A0AAT9HL24_9ACTN